MRAKTLMSAAVVAMLCGSAASGDFRVRPYLMSPTTTGVRVNWFTTSDAPGALTVSGPGLSQPVVIGSAPEVQPVLDYQFPEELSAGNFASTAVLANGQPARSWKHSVEVTGLLPGETYAYSVTQGSAVHTGTLRTAPEAGTDRAIRLAVVSDSETLVLGRTRFREWARTTPQAPGSTGRPAGTGRGRDAYFLTETVGYQENIKAIKARQPDLLVMPGDLIEGTGNEQQRRWDEFWRHNAGEYDTLLSNVPLVAAIGNNCIFNGTGPAFLSTNERIQFARRQWSAYFDWPSNGNPNHQDLYYRQDYGPITIITLCVVKATDELNHLVAPAQGQATLAQSSNRDTNRAWFNVLYPFNDMPDFNRLVRNPDPQGQPVVGEQWAWAEQQLAAARAAGRVIFVQWHHTPYSRGVHGSSITSNQSGEATRIYTPLLEQYRVAGVFCGHSEVAERSFRDADGDGYGINYWDVGFAGDGLRGVEDAPGLVNPAITAWLNANPGQGFTMNPFSQWTADQSQPETWEGNRLLSGGKHYGFLEVDVERVAGKPGRFRVTAQPYHVFPLNDGSPAFAVTGYDFRRYNDRVVLEGPADDLRPVPVSVCAADCDQSGQINALDFSCFLGRFVASDAAAANCDGSTSVPVLNALDFGCFLRRFQQGCD